MLHAYRIAVVVKSWVSHSLDVISGLASHRSSRARFELIDLDWTMDTEELPDVLEGLRIDGVIGSFSVSDYRLTDGVTRSSIPIVNMGSLLPESSIPCVTKNLDPQAILIAEHLRPLHGASVGLLFDDQSSYNSNQASILRDHLKADGREVFEFHESWAGNRERYGSGDDAQLGGWLTTLPKPADIVCDHGYYGQWVLRTAESRRFTVPNEVRVISLLDERICLFSTPPQTSISSGGTALGQAAMALMDGLLAGEPAPLEPMVIEPESLSLTIRGSTVPGGLNLDPIQRAVRYIEQHACDRITVDDVVRQCPDIGRTRFYQLFMEETGLTPAALIRKTRVERAAELIRQTNFKLGQIAELSGFSSASQLTTIFHRVIGTSPSQFRNRPTSS